jgi:hypothetical protein
MAEVAVAVAVVELQVVRVVRVEEALVLLALTTALLEQPILVAVVVAQEEPPALVALAL